MEYFEVSDYPKHGELGCAFLKCIKFSELVISSILNIRYAIYAIVKKRIHFS